MTLGPVAVSRPLIGRVGPKRQLDRDGRIAQALAFGRHDLGGIAPHKTLQDRTAVVGQAGTRLGNRGFVPRAIRPIYGVTFEIDNIAQCHRLALALPAVPADYAPVDGVRKEAQILQSQHRQQNRLMMSQSADLDRQ